MKYIYGIESISIGEPQIDIEKYSEFISKPLRTNRQGGIQFSGSFRIHESDLSPKLMRQLFGNNWNKAPKQVVCRFKLKNKAFARPVYQTFVFPRQSVDTKEKWQSIAKFFRDCYK